MGEANQPLRGLRSLPVVLSRNTPLLRMLDREVIFVGNTFFSNCETTAEYIQRFPGEVCLQNRMPEYCFGSKSLLAGIYFHGITTSHPKKQTSREPAQRTDLFLTVRDLLSGCVNRRLSPACSHLFRF